MSSSPPPPPVLRPNGELLETPCPAVDGLLGVACPEPEREVLEPPMTVIVRAKDDKLDPPLPFDCGGALGRPLLD